jgi:hypothetical protein
MTINNTVSTFNPETVREAYAQEIVDGMDYKTMERFVYDTLCDNLTSYSNEQLKTEIVECYGEEWFASLITNNN